MTYLALTDAIDEAVRAYHYNHAGVPTVLFLGRAQKAALGDVPSGMRLRDMAVHYVEDEDYLACY